MNATYFLISTLFNLYLMVVLLRLWLQLARADFYNPVSKFVVKATHPIVGPMRRVLPSIGSLDTATLLLAFGIGILKITILHLLFTSGGLNPAAIAFTGVMTVLQESFSLVFWVLVIRALLSWFSQGANPIEMLLHQLTDPILSPIRRVIPPMGGLDLSVVFAVQPL